MSVTAPVRRRPSPSRAAAAAVLLALAVSGCSGLGRTAVGPITYVTERDKEISVMSPTVRGCHRMAPAGVKAIENGSLVDMVLYRTRDCTGGGTTYVSRSFSDEKAPRSLPWRSYTFVH
ncbi:hypothetical protein [uncultured Streptomyces sp.]|uniref:hypothetical protein n=1 Tax=uncultured Streptomyces sp. TaxID=174707 RepID=UPI00262A8EEA|nr:hypothetical protein [uncultured Streptomyces sp.]